MKVDAGAHEKVESPFLDSVNSPTTGDSLSYSEVFSVVDGSRAATGSGEAARTSHMS